jgi:O-antigen/teichoic acid export membrane protein
VLAAYGVSSLVAVLATAAVMAYCHFARDPGDPLYASAPFAVWFVVATAAWSLFNLQDSALTGLHASTWIPLENGLYGLVKLALLVVVAHTSLVDGVFTSWTLPVLALVVPVNLLIFRRLLPRHAVEGAGAQDPPSRSVLTRYMTGDYAGTVFRQLSSTFLPVLVVSMLGAVQGAYFLPTQTIFGAIAMLQLAITSSLVVEASRNPDSAARYARSMLRRIAVTVLPAAVVVIVAAPLILMLFGAHYSACATPVLRLMMFALFPGMLLALYVTRCRLENRTGTLALLQGVQAAMMIGGTVLLSGRIGLAAVGWSVLVAELLPALLVAPGVVRWLRSARQLPLA